MASKKKADESNQQKTTRQPRRDGKARSGRATRDAAPESEEGPVDTAPRAAERPADRGSERNGPTGKVVVEREIGGRVLSLETGRMAKLSDGACVVRYGDTMVLATVNSGKAPDNIDFFPLTVDYREKTSAAGVIPGGFFKREGRPTTKEILASRLIDRSIRPMFPDGFRREVQVLSQVLSTDRENDPDVIAAIASFAALALSSLPHGQSLGMVRIGQVDGKLVVNPLWSVIQGGSNKLNLTLAGHKDAIMMVEAGAEEVSEETMIEALELAHDVVREIAGMIDELCSKAGRAKMAFNPPKRDDALVDAIEAEFGEELRRAPLLPGTKQTRGAATKAAKEKAAAKFHAPTGSSESETKAWNMKVSEILSDIAKDAERQSILRGKRADGRDTKSIRPITIEVGVLPRVHGSSLFTRGETQALGVVTLGGVDDQQIIDGLMPEPRKRFLLHYSFPPFSVGEVKKQLAPGRREIGHGALAERGLEAVLPSREEFPYTIRITSEILESNGSSSMATVCAGTLAMMDAGVAIKQPVAGIAMGLVMEGKRYAILSDILGSEDACGDMDFKVVGTGRGITALQMDIKCDGLTRAIMAEALEQAKQGRLHILREMLKALRAPRKELSPNAPRLESVQVPAGKIGMIIGPGGKNIRAMQEQFEVKISIEDSGLCTITGLNAEKVKAAVDHVKAMTAEVELGSVYEGRVTAIKEFGAFVEILPGQEGLVHVSELSDGFIRAVTDVARIGDTLKVKVIAIDDFGKIKLSRKALLGGAAGGGDAGAPAAAGAPPRADRPERTDRPDRPERMDRPERGDRPDRGDRGPRPERFERGDRPERGEFRDRGDRPERADRPERTDRPERADRPERTDRPEHGDRGPRGDRPERERSFGNREERGPRPEWTDRPAGRGERDGGRPEGGHRPVREERPRFEGRDRDERRPPREERPFGADRPQRPARGDEGAEFSRGPRHDGGERGDRGDRGPRPPRDVDAGDRGPRAPRDAEAGDRGPRREGGRDERWGRHDAPPVKGGDERRERRPEPREARPVGEDRPRGSEGGGFGRDRGDRPERSDRGERGPRPERIERPDREDRAPRGDRPERSDRGGAGGRPGRSNLPMREFGDDDFERPAAAKPPVVEVGNLEPIDDVLGEDAPRDRDPRRRGGGRRPRH